jgi:hypothetical protein
MFSKVAYITHSLSINMDKGKLRMQIVHSRCRGVPNLKSHNALSGMVTKGEVLELHTSLFEMTK